MQVHKQRTRAGALLIGVMVFSAIALTTVTAFIGWAVTLMRLNDHISYQEQAMQIAEAGAEYYRWHLAHYPDDFQDGTGDDGPYVHVYYDRNGVAIGEYSLTITPPGVGSTKVIIESTGSVYADASASRILSVEVAKPSFAKWSVVANSEMRFGEGTETYGELHSNAGIRYDGVAYNTVSSALLKYDDPDHDESGTDKQEYAVHTHVKPPPLTGSYSTYVAAETPPASMQSRTDIFKAGRKIGEPAVDFAGLTLSLAELKTLGNSANGDYYGSSGKSGYHVVLKTNDTYDLYRVTKLATPSGSCQKPSNDSTQDGWGTWSIKSSGGETLLGNYAFPANGVIFFEDHVWVNGTINGARLTIAAGQFPESSSTWKSITVNTDLLYTNYDGTDVIGLIAQNNVNAGLLSDDDLRIDAALVAQNGRVGRYYYGDSNSSAGGNCGSNANKTQLTSYGMIASNKRYGFAYTDNTGYETRDLVYDENLLYSPPPSFPLATDDYEIIKWEEL